MPRVASGQSGRALEVRFCSVERAAGALEAGADIVSAVTDITLHDDPEARMLAWLEATG